jgi:DNA uptake protein ComE-like DNA-binding protein
MKSSYIAAVSAISLAAAALRKPKRRNHLLASEPPVENFGVNLVDLNEASKEEFIELDGFEPQVAERIIKMRPYRDHADAARKLGTYLSFAPEELKAA